jgi:hypothetical protein
LVNNNLSIDKLLVNFYKYYYDIAHIYDTTQPLFHRWYIQTKQQVKILSNDIMSHIFRWNFTLN